MDWVLGKVVDQSDCGASLGNTKITDLVVADDAVVFFESLEVLVMALEGMHEEAKALGLEVSWLKTKVQVFGGLLDEKVQSVHACAVDKSDCGASIGNTKITDFVVTEVAVIFAESLEVLVMALEALHEETKPLGLKVTWLMTKVQALMSPGPTATEGTNSTSLSNKMGKELESWC
ncbi:hypothetical protein GWK47_042757 [Chionoecetes opilio]|uniref:Uncharacterized protein n=1 Tax=Chionoecetes opilio TaxID=41210 RepID=A0A8J5CZZ9_CHIOP|nr:hypothetical protein GWK47_042757 [Chionoecetes opilio]